jgi:hypothetical protein
MGKIIEFLAGVLLFALMGLFMVLCIYGSGYHWE